jgi:hypothetical protein
MLQDPILETSSPDIYCAVVVAVSLGSPLFLFEDNLHILKDLVPSLWIRFLQSRAHSHYAGQVQFKPLDAIQDAVHHAIQYILPTSLVSVIHVAKEEVDEHTQSVSSQHRIDDFHTSFPLGRLG